MFSKKNYANKHSTSRKFPNRVKFGDKHMIENDVSSSLNHLFESNALHCNLEIRSSLEGRKKSVDGSLWCSVYSGWTLIWSFGQKIILKKKTTNQNNMHCAHLTQWMHHFMRHLNVLIKLPSLHFKQNPLFMTCFMNKQSDYEFTSTKKPDEKKKGFVLHELRLSVFFLCSDSCPGDSWDKFSAVRGWSSRLGGWKGLWGWILQKPPCQQRGIFWIFGHICQRTQQSEQFRGRYKNIPLSLLWV